MLLGQPASGNRNKNQAQHPLAYCGDPARVATCPNPDFFTETQKVCPSEDRAYKTETGLPAVRHRSKTWFALPYASQKHDGVGGGKVRNLPTRPFQAACGPASFAQEPLISHGVSDPYVWSESPPPLPWVLLLITDFGLTRSAGVG